MNFDTLDERMRVYETAHDHRVMPGLRVVARLDGRNFSTLTKGSDAFDPPLERPFDARFREAMSGTAEHLMNCGFPVVFAYHQSDEVSLLFAADAEPFGRKERKINSVLAGEASAFFSRTLGVHGVFDCRVSQLPGEEHVVDYFRWRSADALRNALSAHCHWALRGEGLSARAATAELTGKSTAQKNELLFERGVNFNDLPAWQKRGVGLWWETYEKPGVDPRTGTPAAGTRRRVHRELELPVGDAWARLLGRLAAERA